MPKKKNITPEYNLRAAKKYSDKFAKKTIRIPLDMFAELEDIYGEGFSVNAYMLGLIKKDMEEKKNS